MRQIVVIAHNLRSTHNVGSLFRTCEGLGVAELLLSGYTPYPQLATDARLPHESAKVNKQISKTALGTESTLAWEHLDDLQQKISEFKQAGYVVAAVEQVDQALALPDYKPPDKLVLILGREVEGIEMEVLASCDICLEIPMFGNKESYNVVQAAAMALYHCRFA